MVRVGQSTLGERNAGAGPPPGAGGVHAGEEGGLLAGITAKNLRGEIRFGGPAGNEVL